MKNISDFQFSLINKSSNYWEKVISLAKQCDNDFYPPLSQRMAIEEYFERFNNKNGFVTIVTKNELLIGSSCGFFFHPEYKVAYSQFTLIDRDHRDKILARKLINFVFKVCKESGAFFIQGRTWSTNFASQKLIKDTGFYLINTILNDRPNNVHTYEYEKCLYENTFFDKIERFGILGGMGSLASAKFLTNIYELNSQTEHEQEQIPIVLNSETNTPDRSKLILAGQYESLKLDLEIQLRNLVNQGVSHIVICCLSYHAVLNLITPELRKFVVSLIDFINHMLNGRKGKYLVLLTNGSYKLKLLKLGSNIIYPQPADQEIIHDCIYRLKKGEPKEIIIDEMLKLIDNYVLSGIILGCTDLYLLHELFIKRLENLEIINPLKLMSYNISDSWKNTLTHEN